MDLGPWNQHDIPASVPTKVTLYAESDLYKETSPRARKFSLLSDKTAYSRGITIPLS